MLVFGERGKPEYPEKNLNTIPASWGFIDVQTARISAGAEK